jgi:hypothetical protein
MFDWLKRLVGGDSVQQEAAELARARAAKRSSRAATSNNHHHLRPTGPAPLPQVVGEGNSQEDWSEWESSMMGLDSQMQHLPETARIYEKDSRYTRPAPLEDDTPDAFGKAHKNRDI